MKNELNDNHSGYYMLDFHRFTVEQARVALNRAFSTIADEQMKELYIITGRGNHRNANGTHGVLKRAMRKLLKPYEKFISEIVEENAAYRVLLKKRVLLEDPVKLPKEYKLGFEKIVLETLTEFTNKGDLDAKLQLAQFLIASESKEHRDVNRGVSLLKELYEKNGLIEAGYLLGYIYTEGCEELEADYKLGLKYLHEVAEKRCAKAYGTLAVCYLTGKGVHHSDEKAIQYLKKLADDFNDSHAAAQLGRYYFDGNLVTRNNELAIKYLKIGANAGDSMAQVYLARCYACGYGVEQSYQQARQYYLKAAKQNNTYALCMLGQYAEVGRVVEKNLEIAFSFYERGAELGDLDSYFKVAKFRVEGKGTARDVELGLEQLENLAETHHGTACFYLGLIYYSGEIVTKDAQRGLQLIQTGARYKDSDSNYWLAKRYFAGDAYIKQDPEKGIACLKIAAETVHEGAYYLLGLYLCQGKYINKNIVEGVKYLRVVLEDLDNTELMRLILQLSTEGALADFVIELVKKVSKNCDTKTKLIMACALLENNIDETLAETLLKAAIQEGNKDAKHTLASYYIKQKNGLSKALPLFEQVAVELDDLEVQSWLGTVYAQTREYENFEKAKIFLEMAVKKHHAESCYLLAINYFKNMRDPYTFSKAFELLQLAADQNYQPAIELLPQFLRLVEEAPRMENSTADERESWYRNIGSGAPTVFPADDEIPDQSSELQPNEISDPNTEINNQEPQQNETRWHSFCRLQ